jgi:two-component system sensor histidine kinase UhpB
LAGVPLLYKILGANAAIVVVGAVAGTAISLHHGALHPGAPHYDLMALFAIVGTALSLAVNFLVLRTVLRPLDHLQQAVESVAEGQRGVRVARERLADDRLRRLADTFDRMIETLEDHTERLRLLPGQILRAQEEERQRIARELHDEAAQSMTSLLVRLRLLEQARTPEIAQQRVKELREIAARALEDVRRVAVELRPSVLDDLGLVDALHAHADDLNRGAGMRVEVSADGPGGRLPTDLELAFYRVAQEALTNAQRHGHAARARVRLHSDGSRVVLEVADDGVGFDARRQTGAGGLGLAGMRERMALVGGDVTVHTEPGSGTRIVATAPLAREQTPITGGQP